MAKLERSRPKWWSELVVVRFEYLLFGVIAVKRLIAKEKFGVGVATPKQSQETIKRVSRANQAPGKVFRAPFWHPYISNRVDLAYSGAGKTSHIEAQSMKEMQL